MPLRKLLNLVFIGLIAGCTNDPLSTNDDNSSDLKFTTSKSESVEREVILSGDSRIAEQAASINQFAVKMYSQLIKADSNTFFSPYSITCALGMADAGALGSTDEQIRKALQVTLSGDDLHAAINGLDQSLKSHSESNQNLDLNVVNSIWAQNGYALRIPYLDKLSRHYEAGINLLNFMEDPDNCRIIINDWVSEQTKERITDLIPKGGITTDTRVVLTNAIYFLADWLVKFDSTKTENQTFRFLNRSSSAVPMMVMEGKDDKTGLKLLYNRTESARVLELPYQGERIVMDFILPDTGAFRQFESSLTMNDLNVLLEGLDSTVLPCIRIPRFQFTTQSISLVDALYNLGMEAPFSPNADFRGICEESLFIKDIVHKAFIKVNENGTEAAAATAIIFDRSSTDSPSFVADRPFIYLIRDTHTKAILFMGRVLDPTVTQ